MKAHLSVFALSAILIVSIGMAPAFGQSSIVITTDKASYSEGETVLITGEVTQLLGGYAIGLQVIAPNGNIVSIDQLTVGADKKFSTTVAAGGALMKIEGTYTIAVTRNVTSVYPEDVIPVTVMVSEPLSAVAVIDIPEF